MVSRSTRLLTPLLVLLSFTMTGPAFAQADTKAKKAPIHPALMQVEEDPNLPRVLLIGDSITMGYTVPLREMLAKKANVQHPEENCGPSRRIVEHLDIYLGKKKWDVIQLNCGIHDLTYLNETHKVTGPKDGGKPQVSLEEYRANLEKIVARLKKTGAKLIWCTTTPMNHPDVYRLPEDVDRYNAVAKEVMKKNGVQINDLNRTVRRFKKPMWTSEGVHFTPDGYQELAKAAASAIEAALTKPQKEPLFGVIYLLNDFVPYMVPSGTLNLQCDIGRRVGRRFSDPQA